MSLRRWRERWADFVGTFNEVKAAEMRWKYINADSKAAGCRCGKPAERVRFEYGNVGSVPVEIWSCEEHYGVNKWVTTNEGWRPL